MPKTAIKTTMFTGIITDIGVIESVEKKPKGMRVAITTSYNTKDIKLGASIACAGICLTAIAKSDNSFSVDISEETISCTNVSDWKKGTMVNLERALKAGFELGGHIVSGHIDSVAEIIKIKEIHEDHEVIFRAPKEFSKFIAEKGSITLDGVSLTVNKVSGNEFSVNIIPHTWKETTLGKLRVGDKVNMEVDLMARYAARLMEGVK